MQSYIRIERKATKKGDILRNEEVRQRREGRLLVRYDIGLSGPGDGFVHIFVVPLLDHVSRGNEAPADFPWLYGPRTLFASVKVRDRVIFNFLSIVGRLL